MKTVLLFFFLVLALPVWGQHADSLAAVAQVDSLLQVASKLTGQRQFEQALAVNAEAERLALAHWGRESAVYGRCCIGRGGVFDFKEDLTNAEKWYLDARGIYEKTVGKEHPDYATSLNDLGFLYWKMGQYGKAEPLHLEAKDIREKALGKEHSDYAASLNNLAMVYMRTGQHGKAELFLLEAKDIFEKTLGKEHPYYVNSLNNLGNLYSNLGQYGKAELFFLEAKDIRGKTLGKEHSQYGASLNDLGVLYWKMGQHKKAEPLYLEAKTIFEKTLGKEHPFYANSLTNLGIIYMNMSQYEKAEPFLLEAKDIRGKALGKEHPIYASSLMNLAAVYSKMGRYEKAEPLFLEAIAIREKTLGKGHIENVLILLNLGTLYMQMGQYEKAEPLLFEAKDIQKKALGKEHPEYARSLHSLANLYNTLGKYEKAEPLFLEAIAIQKKALGKGHPEYAASLNDLANLYINMGQYEKAEPFLLDAKGIFDKTLGKKHPFYANSLGNLAQVYTNLSQYEKAEPLQLEAKAIREKTLGKGHIEITISLVNLASMYNRMGQYEKAEPLLLEAKAIQEKTLGKEHPDYAASLNNLAILYMDMGQYEKAEPLLLETKTIREKTLGKEHPHYAGSLSSLAILYMDMGQYEKAEPLYLEAMAIKEKALGKEGPDYTTGLNNLGGLYWTMGQYEKAEPFFLEAIAIREKALGKEHPDYASSLNNLTSLYMDMGQYEKAEPLFLEVKAIWEKTLGKEHPYYAFSLNNLGILYSKLGQYEKAEPLYLELSSADKHRLEKAALHLSERELHIYLNTFSAKQNSTLTFAQTTGSKVLIPVCYDNSLFYKGFLLQSTGHIRQLALSDAAASEQINRLKGYQRRLAASYALPKAERDSALVAQLETQANDLEKELARTVAGYSQTKRQVSWQEVQASLKPGEAAVEFVHYRFNGGKSTDSTMYAALLLLSGTAQPAFIPLFEEKSLDSLLQTRGERRADYVNGLYTVADRGATPLGKPQKTLYEMLWQPLEKSLPTTPPKGGGDKLTVYFSPSGLLHRLNLGAIPIPASVGGGQGEAEEETLSDHYQLVEMGSTRQLVVPHPMVNSEKNAMLFGGIQYEMDSTAMAQENLSLGSDAQLASRRGLSFANADSTLRGGTWSYLKWTDKEVTALEPILKTAGIEASVRKGFAATEESFKATGAGRPSPRILHIATHGYFFPDPKTSARVETSPTLGAAEPVFKISDHPMLRSGLILAGGNAAWQGAITMEGREDGILTAYEISQMNLTNTELVVLSACETGLGDISGNEGVYGLQRAFKIAGAKYLVMSLWQVPDKQTSLLMTTFYKKWLEEKMAIPEAFRAAQKELREAGLDPYQWAGFVLVK